MVVVGLAAAVMTAVPGLPGSAVQVPAPVAAMVAVPPGSRTHGTLWSGPALGLAVTVTTAVSAQPEPLVQIKL